ncbi:MAG: dipeptide epimerase [Candidatus Omnitrophica bacterium]|nr:dipeptide epimerase [Candidatus Omnitrophota bacterium]
MKNNISRVEVLSVNIPFKRSFKHSYKSRNFSESVFVRLSVASGVSGFGEALPRQYVTGECQDDVFKALSNILPDTLLGKKINSLEEAVPFCKEAVPLNGPAKCAFETALLDCASRISGEDIADIFGGVKRKRLEYSGAIGCTHGAETVLSAIKLKIFGIKEIKLKVGDDRDIERIKTSRSLLGRDADIRLDANCSWTAEEAIDKLGVMRNFGFSAIEQPSAKDDIDSLAKISEAIPEPVMADESLCTLDDAERLIRRRACRMFNIRLSKCGGMLDSARIADLARKNGVTYQLGCQVGESGVLSAAGRIFAACFEDIRYLEGSYAKFLLKEDIVTEDVSFGYGGRARPLKGTGLGVSVDEGKLNKYVKDRKVFK